MQTETKNGFGITMIDGCGYLTIWHGYTPEGMAATAECHGALCCDGPHCNRMHPLSVPASMDVVIDRMIEAEVNP